MLNLDGNSHVMLHVSVQKPGQQEMSTQLSKISWRLCSERFHLGKRVLLKKTMCHAEMLLVVRDAPSSTSARLSCLGGFKPPAAALWYRRKIVSAWERSSSLGVILTEMVVTCANLYWCWLWQVLFLFLFFFTLNYHNALPHFITHADQQRVVNFPSADLGRLPALKCWGKGYGVGLGLAFSRD